MTDNNLISEYIVYKRKKFLIIRQIFNDLFFCGIMQLNGGSKMKVTKETFLSDWPEFIVTEATREAAKKNPNITDVRLRRGMFRTDEEEEQRRERLRALPLPGDEIEETKETPKVMKKIKRYLKMN